MSHRRTAPQRVARTTVKRRLARITDYLATRWEQHRSRCVLGGLQSVARRAGCSGEWIAAHVYPMAARHPEIVTYGRSKAAAIALAGVLAGCASTGQSTVHTDVYCVEQLPTTVIVGTGVFVIDGGCRAWMVSPTPREREAFEQLHPKREAP